MQNTNKNTNYSFKKYDAPTTLDEIVIMNDDTTRSQMQEHYNYNKDQNQDAHSYVFCDSYESNAYNYYAVATGADDSDDDFASL